ncbi:MAG: YggT family protein [Alphaproteobacteria bacterium]|nr:YggT family protein [Alphaproteobacteria bacterium]
MMSFLGELLLLALDIYLWVIIASVAISWLLTFEVLNARNPQAQNLIRLLQKATDPVYRPLRRFIPPLGGLDFTPLVVIFGIYFLKRVVVQLFIY